jgi:hypothetical protein
MHQLEVCVDALYWHDVGTLVAVGKSGQAIANLFGESAKTIEVRRSKVMEKMHAVPDAVLSRTTALKFQRQPRDIYVFVLRRPSTGILVDLRHTPALHD